MPFPSFTESLGSRSAVGIAKEATFGTAVAATSFAPATGITIEPDPGLFSPSVMMAQRDRNIFALYGQYKFGGAIDGPLFPTNGIQLLTGSIGVDQNRIGFAASTPASSGTVDARSVGATTIVYTYTGSLPSAPFKLQIGETTFGAANLPAIGSPSTSQVVTCTGAGASPVTLTVTDAGGLSYATTGGQAAATTIGPFAHQIFQGNTLPSFTIEKNLGSSQSEQYVGCRVGKFSTKLGATDTECAYTADILAQSVNILTTPTATSYTNENPFVFAEATLSMFGQTLLQATNIQIDIDNGLKPQWTFSSTRNLSFLSPTVRHISGTLDVVWDNLNDTNFGYFDKLLGIDQAQPQGALSLTLTHPAASSFSFNPGFSHDESIQINLSAVNLSKYADAVKLEDIIITTLGFEAFLNLGATPVQTINAVVTNNTSTLL